MGNKYKKPGKSKVNAYHKEFEDIIKLVKYGNSLALQAFNIYNQEVENIIRTRSEDIKYIEKTLDRILGFCFNQDMLNIFKKLCRYYYFIDKHATTEYISFYREMWEDDYEK